MIQDTRLGISTDEMIRELTDIERELLQVLRIQTPGVNWPPGPAQHRLEILRAILARLKAAHD